MIRNCILGGLVSLLIKQDFISTSLKKEWPKKGKPANKMVPFALGISITILGEISTDGVIGVPLFYRFKTIYSSSINRGVI
jgi:hypothetical protein